MTSTSQATAARVQLRASKSKRAAKRSAWTRTLNKRKRKSVARAALRTRPSSLAPSVTATLASTGHGARRSHRTILALASAASAAVSATLAAAHATSLNERGFLVLDACDTSVHLETALAPTLASVLTVPAAWSKVTTSKARLQTKFDAVPRLEGFTNAFFVPILATLAALGGSGRPLCWRALSLLRCARGRPAAAAAQGWLPSNQLPPCDDGHSARGVDALGPWKSSGRSEWWRRQCWQRRRAVRTASRLATVAFVNLDHCGAAKGNHARVFAYVEMVEAEGEMYKLSESKLQQGVQTFASEEHKLDARVACHSEQPRTSTRSDCTCCL